MKLWLFFPQNLGAHSRFLYLGRKHTGLCKVGDVFWITWTFVFKSHISPIFFIFGLETSQEFCSGWESSLKKLFCPHHSFDVTISLSFLLPLLWSTFPDFKRKPLLFFKAPSCLHLCILYCFFLMPPFHLETTSWTWTFHSNKHHSWREL